MRQIWLLVSTGALTLLIIGAATVLFGMMRRQHALAARIQLSRGIVSTPDPTGQQVAHLLWMRLIAGLGQLILRTGLLPTRTLAELEQTLNSAGLPGRNGLAMFLGGKISLLAALPVLSFLSLRGASLPPALSIILPPTAAIIGMLLPDMIVRFRRKRYVRGVEQGLPDALDLLVICAQAGLGLSTAIARVAEELQYGHHNIGQEMAITANEMQMMADSRAALLNLGARTGVEGLARLGTTLVQSMQYGTPLSEAMRVLSAEMRQETLNRFEAKAARLGVLLTVPMIVFILPCVFLVVGGPAAVQVLHISP